MSIALIGATGRTGRLVAEKLHRAGIPFRALLRDEAQRAQFESRGGSPVIVDLTQDFCAALAGVNTLIFAAGSAESAPDALRHYAQMKRASDDYLIGSGLDYLVLRPATLTMEPGTGKIEIVADAQSARAPVAREDVADVALEALRIGLVNTIVGFAGGSKPIDDALAALH
ncbi:NAD(P)H-binding protein [Paraburkholderia caledonica]|uniref:NAD(P)H-binding protein n=1 Tax=Paraburkholderia caledonica TaxID=134536 RepID=UPI0038B6EF2B